MTSYNCLGGFDGKIYLSPFHLPPVLMCNKLKAIFFGGDKFGGTDQEYFDQGSNEMSSLTLL